MLIYLRRPLNLEGPFLEVKRFMKPTNENFTEEEIEFVEESLQDLLLDKETNKEDIAAKIEGSDLPEASKERLKKFNDMAYEVASGMTEWTVKLRKFLAKNDITPPDLLDIIPAVVIQSLDENEIGDKEQAKEFVSEYFQRMRQNAEGIAKIKYDIKG